jgi:hypothetical protein
VCAFKISLFLFICFAYSQPSYRDLVCCSWKILSEISSAGDYASDLMGHNYYYSGMGLGRELLANHSTNLSLWPWSTVEGVVLSPNADS